MNPVVRPTLVLALLSLVSCAPRAADAPHRASGYVEATEVRVASKVAGRVVSVAVSEGTRVSTGDPMATLATTDLDLGLQRVRAERAQADAQSRLVQAGSRAEDVTQAEAQVAAAGADERAARAELAAARNDEARFEQLLERRAGSRKQRDDAVARRELAEARVQAAAERAAAARATLARLRAGARSEEVQAARARVAALDAQIAAIEHDRSETAIVAPVAGVVTARLVEPGEIISAGMPVAVVVDLDRAWVNAYVEEPLVPALRLDQAVTIITDAGDRLPGRVAFIAPRAEFTPRNVQTANERARLVYRVRIATDNRSGLLKPGMPVEIDLP